MQFSECSEFWPIVPPYSNPVLLARLAIINPWIDQDSAQHTKQSLTSRRTKADNRPQLASPRCRTRICACRPPPPSPPPIFRASKSARQLMRLRSYTTANRVNSGHLNIQSSEFRSTEYTRSHRARPFSTTSYQYPSLRLLLQHGSAPQPAAPCKTASI